MSCAPIQGNIIITMQTMAEWKGALAAFFAGAGSFVLSYDDNLICCKCGCRCPHKVPNYNPICNMCWNGHHNGNPSEFAGKDITKNQLCRCMSCGGTGGIGDDRCNRCFGNGVLVVR